MDLESIKRLNTPHFCQWYLKRLQAVLDKEKRAEYSHVPCNTFDDLSKIIEHSQSSSKWDQRAYRWVSNNPVIYCHARIAGTDGYYETRELTEDFIRCMGIAAVPFFPNYIKEYKAPATSPNLAAYFSAIKSALSTHEFDRVVEELANGGTRASIGRFIHGSLDASDRVTPFVLETFEPPYYAFDEDSCANGGFLSVGYDSKCLLLPNKELIKKALTPPAKVCDDSLEEFFGSVGHLYPTGLWGKIRAKIADDCTRKQVADFIFDNTFECHGVISQYVKETFEPPYYAFDMDGRGGSDGFMENEGSSKCLIFPNKDLRKKVLTPPAESVECSTVETKQEGNKEMSTVNAIKFYLETMEDPLYQLPSITREDIRNAGRKSSFAALAQKLKEEGARTSDSDYRTPFTRQFDDLVWYDYHTNKVITSGSLEGYGFLLPVPKSALPNGDLSVLFMADATAISTKKSGVTKVMSTIKETAIKSKDQVIKTAIGQAGVAGIKSLILTALPMKIGFIGRLLGRHRQVANNSVVVAGIAVLANQIGQQYVKNENVKNALQATQDQALTEVLNEYVGIENKVDAVVSNALQLDKQPVTVDQE